MTRIMVGPLTEIMSPRNALGQSKANPNGILQFALSDRCYPLSKTQGKHRLSSQKVEVVTEATKFYDILKRR